jgi:hypothetical protein
VLKKQKLKRENLKVGQGVHIKPLLPKTWGQREAHRPSQEFRNVNWLPIRKRVLKYFKFVYGNFIKLITTIV